MKKLILLCVTIVLLSACSNNEIINITKASTTNMEPKGNYNLEDIPERAITMNTIVVDDKYFKAIIIFVQSTTSISARGEKQVKFYIENKAELNSY